MATKLHQQRGMQLMPIIPRKCHTKYDFDKTYTKGVIKVSFGCHGNWVTIAMRYVANAYCLKERPYQITEGILDARSDPRDQS